MHLTLVASIYCSVLVYVPWSAYYILYAQELYAYPYNTIILEIFYNNDVCALEKYI